MPSQQLCEVLDALPGYENQNCRSSAGDRLRLTLTDAAGGYAEDVSERVIQVVPRPAVRVPSLDRALRGFKMPVPVHLGGSVS
jgi:hypothetical protein